MKSLELLIFIFGICIAYFSYVGNINGWEHTRHIEVREITNLCGVNCVYIVELYCPFLEYQIEIPNHINIKETSVELKIFYLWAQVVVRSRNAFYIGLRVVGRLLFIDVKKARNCWIKFNRNSALLISVAGRTKRKLIRFQKKGSHF